MKSVWLFKSPNKRLWILKLVQIFSFYSSMAEAETSKRSSVWCTCFCLVTSELVHDFGLNYLNCSFPQFFLYITNCSLIFMTTFVSSWGQCDRLMLMFMLPREKTSSTPPRKLAFSTWFSVACRVLRKELAKTDVNILNPRKQYIITLLNKVRYLATIVAASWHLTHLLLNLKTKLSYAVELRNILHCLCVNDFLY